MPIICFNWAALTSDWFTFRSSTALKFSSAVTRARVVRVVVQVA